MPSQRTDAAIGWSVAAGSVATMAVTTWIGFRSWDALWGAVIHPLDLERPQALVTGLWASNLMILQVLFMARLPWLERAWGREVLTRWHRQLGYWSFWLMLLHVLLFAVQRAQVEPGARAAAMGRLFATDPWMLVATLGTALIVLVVVTSIVEARRRMRYETWHLVHLYAYLGMGLALPHQLVSGDFRVGWIAAYWWLLYLGTLVAVLVCRVGLPVYRSARHGLRIEQVRPEVPGTVSVVMTGRDLHRLGTTSGQFFIWRFLGRSGWTRGHPYSVSAAPDGQRLRVTIASGPDTAGPDGDGQGSHAPKGPRGPRDQGGPGEPPTRWRPGGRTGRRRPGPDRGTVRRSAARAATTSAVRAVRGGRGHHSVPCPPRGW